MYIKNFPKNLLPMLHADPDELDEGGGLQLKEWNKTKNFYRPWVRDKDFMETYLNTIGTTLIGIDRCFNLWKLVREAEKLPEGNYLEVGVYRGGSSLLINKRKQLLGSSACLYACDTFEGVVKAGPKDNIYKGGEHSVSISFAENLFKRFDMKNFKIMKGTFPEEDVFRELDHQKFRFCHIDVDVYQSAKDATEYLFPKLVSGGIIVYDDYGFYNCEGIRQLIYEQEVLPDRLVNCNSNGQALIIKH